MKKNILTILAILVFSTSAFGAGADVTSDGNLNIGGSADSDGVATKELGIGLSPKVNARYVTDGTDETTAQWYAIGTVHPGGKIGYGTAQDVNNIYMISYVTGSAVSTVLDTMPTEKNPEEGVDAEGKPIAAATWTNNGWSLTPPTE